MNFRTDLVIETQSMHTENLSGATTNEMNFGKCKLVLVDIKSNDAAQKLSKPCGKYYTARFDRLDTIPDTNDIKQAIIYALESLLPQSRENILIVGLGNADITPDALGPLCAGKILATRHIGDDLKSALGLSGLKCVCALIPGVLGKTGIEVFETVSGAVKIIKPNAVIVIDALAASKAENLCRTIQLSQNGISPGSGVNNHRKALDKNGLGVPVIAIGMPTVIDAKGYKGFDGGVGDMMVTPKEIDLLTLKAAEVIASALNRFLQPNLDDDILDCLT